MFVYLGSAYLDQSIAAGAEEGEDPTATGERIQAAELSFLLASG